MVGSEKERTKKIFFFYHETSFRRVFPNVGSKARESAKVMSLAFVFLDFQHACVRKRVYCTRRSVDM